MLDPYLAIVVLASVALAIGVVVFGGTTLTYLLGMRRKEAAVPATVQRIQRRSARSVLVDDREASRDKAA